MKKTSCCALKRIRESKAFTLAEALVAMIIMLFVTAIVVAGIPAAFDAYDNVFIASNAEVLLSTTASALRNELGTADIVDIDGTTITYYNEQYASYSRISLGRAESGETLPNDEKTIMYQRYAQDSELGNAPSASGRFISKAASGENLFVTYTGVSISADGTYITFNGLAVKKIKNGVAESTPAVRDKLSIRLYASE